MGLDGLRAEVQLGGDLTDSSCGRRSGARSAARARSATRSRCRPCPAWCGGGGGGRACPARARRRRGDRSRRRLRAARRPLELGRRALDVARTGERTARERPRERGVDACSCVVGERRRRQGDLRGARVSPASSATAASAHLGHRRRQRQRGRVGERARGRGGSRGVLAAPQRQPAARQELEPACPEAAGHVAQLLLAPGTDEPRLGGCRLTRSPAAPRRAQPWTRRPRRRAATPRAP